VLTEETARVMVVGVRLAAPALVASLVSTIAAGMAARAAPALNFFSVALALTLCIGAVVMLDVAPLTVAEIGMAARRVSDVVGRTLGIL
jgi:flagellar biosynthetic protein FliR